ncbi:MAG TPA: hypothetical protein VMG12_22755 [Polyangiaceae bacterium]|nr:hypothetical protein [Polyangiaceae bacterium]
MTLYHFSENPNLEVFHPHIAKTSAIQDEALVWAIDEWHAPMYFVPRDCPRVCFWPTPSARLEARQRWQLEPEQRFAMLVEAAWLARIRSSRIYRYTMPEASFSPIAGARGNYISRETVIPLRVEPLGDLLVALASARVELRSTSRLGPVWRQIRADGALAYSGIRLLNAEGYPSEFLVGEA